jgi:hypothetical protein
MCDVTLLFSVHAWPCLLSRLVPSFSALRWALRAQLHDQDKSSGGTGHGGVTSCGNLLQQILVELPRLDMRNNHDVPVATQRTAPHRTSLAPHHLLRHAMPGCTIPHLLHRTFCTIPHLSAPHRCAFVPLHSAGPFYYFSPHRTSILPLTHPCTLDSLIKRENCEFPIRLLKIWGSSSLDASSSS